MMLNSMQGLTTIEHNFIIRKKIMDDLNDAELVLSSSRVVLEVNEKGIFYIYKSMRDIAKIMYRRTFNLHYRNQSNESKNQVISKLHEAFPDQWLMRPVRLAIEKHTTTKKSNLKSNIPKHIFIEYVPITTKHFFININYAIFSYDINIKLV